MLQGQSWWDCYLDNKSIVQVQDAMTSHAVANRTWLGMCQCRMCTGRCELIATWLVAEQSAVSLALDDAVCVPRSHLIA
jgi:hypothetical protein